MSYSSRGLGPIAAPRCTCKPHKNIVVVNLAVGFRL